MAIKTDTYSSTGGGGGGSDTLDDVTTRGATTTNTITVGGVSVGTEYSLPTVDGSENQVLQTNGSGSLSFATLDFTGGLEYKGTFNATTGLPSLANAEKGDYYKISTGGTIYGQTWDVNDSLLINEDMGGSITNSKIDKIDNTEPTNVLITTNNLSDLDNAGTARTNLGLGNVATLTTGVSNGNVIVADSTGLPAIDGSQLTGITATDSTKLAIANNLSDLNSASTARTNLGLGNVATLSTGVANGNVIVADSTGLPAIDGSQLTGITATDSTKLAIANNLSDLNSASTARTNLGLGNVATLSTGVANGNVIVADSTGLPAIDGSQLTGITATDSTKLAIANNLSDLNSASTARTNLGLGNVATLTTGVSNGNVIVADSTGLPAIDGSQLTGVTATDSTKLAIANNLSDLNNAGTARTNLGLGNVATLTTGVANGNVIVADSTGLPAIDGSQLTGVTATDSTKLAIANNLSDLNNAGTARTNLGLGTASTSASTDFLSATGADSLGGNIDVNGHDIVSSSNGDIEIAPDGNGSFIIKGNATSGSGRIVLNCEQNSHGITLKGPAHSASATYELVLPTGVGTDGQVLKTDGGNGGSPNSVQLAWVDQASGGGSAPTVTSASPSANYTISTHADNEEIYILTPSADISVFLPAASACGSGYKYQIKNLGDYTLTITPDSTASEYIDFSTQTTFDIVQYESVTLVSDGSNNRWFII